MGKFLDYSWPCRNRAWPFVRSNRGVSKRAIGNHVEQAQRPAFLVCAYSLEAIPIAC